MDVIRVVLGNLHRSRLGGWCMFFGRWGLHCGTSECPKGKDSSGNEADSFDRGLDFHRRKIGGRRGIRTLTGLTRPD